MPAGPAPPPGATTAATASWLPALPLAAWLCKQPKEVLRGSLQLQDEKANAVGPTISDSLSTAVGSAVVDPTISGSLSAALSSFSLGGLSPAVAEPTVSEGLSTAALSSRSLGLGPGTITAGSLGLHPDDIAAEENVTAPPAAASDDMARWRDRRSRKAETRKAWAGTYRRSFGGEEHEHSVLCSRHGGTCSGLPTSARH